jgi:NAD(P)-dependent dehydrogenase (short-subunit alcohol dehydrogenase family)
VNGHNQKKLQSRISPLAPAGTNLMVMRPTSSTDQGSESMTHATVSGPMDKDMEGKVIVITGATSGIGQVAAEKLATMGARIVQIVRDHERGREALRRLGERSPDVAHSIHYADLLQISEMKRVAAEIAAAEPRIDVLINNAGAIFGASELTEDGLERTFALNHMSYFVLTHGLQERLVVSAPARVVNTSSRAHKKARGLDFNDFRSNKEYLKAYGRSKLCNILFTRELARRLKGTGVTANCLHPGFVATRFGDQAGGLISFGLRVGKRFAISPQKGGTAGCNSAGSPEATTRAHE